MNRKLFTLLILCAMSSIAFGYDFTFLNNTKHQVNVRVQLLASKEERQIDIPSGKAHVFSFKGIHIGFCLGKVFINNQLKEGLRACRNASFDIIPLGTPAEPANIDVIPR